MAFLVPDSNFQLSIFCHSCLLGSYLQLHASCIISWFLLSSYFWFSPAQILGFWKILTLDCLPSSDPWLHLAPQILNFVQILSLSPYAGIYDLVQLWSWYWQTESQLTMRFRVSKCSYFHGDHTQKSPKISVYGHIKKKLPFWDSPLTLTDAIRNSSLPPPTQWPDAVGVYMESLYMWREIHF